MVPLGAFVRDIRARHGSAPDMDPLDGGIRARLLLLLETPGPQVFKTAFVSRDNPTGTASNLFRYLSEAGIPRRETLIWNAVPWVIQVPGARNRSPRASEARAGIRELPPLLDLLPRLQGVLLAGRVAGFAQDTIRTLRPEVAVIAIPHPSPANVCTSPLVAERIRDGLRRARGLLGLDPA
jgi:hypothetical protein